VGGCVIRRWRAALRRKNGNRPGFFKLREQLMVAFNRQKLTIESGSHQIEIP
jgi:hypothetical protein